MLFAGGPSKSGSGAMAYQRHSAKPKTIHEACHRGDYACVQEFLEEARRRDNVSQLLESPDKDRHDSTPLHTAAFKGHVAIMELLLRAGADINARTDSRQTPLYLAIYQGHIGAIQFLIGHCADCDCVDSWGSTILHEAATSHCSLEVIQLLLQHVAHLLGVRNKNDNCPINLACVVGNELFVSEVLRYIPSQRNLSGRDGNTPLHAACVNGHEGIVRMLLGERAEVNARNYKGDTPLSGACVKGYKRIVRMLLEQGAEVNAREENGNTPLHAACVNGHAEIAQMVLDRGADVNGMRIMPD